MSGGMNNLVLAAKNENNIPVAMQDRVVAWVAVLRSSLPNSLSLLRWAAVGFKCIFSQIIYKSRCTGFPQHTKSSLVWKIQIASNQNPEVQDVLEEF